MSSPINEINESLYVLHEIPGKGQGLVATRNIPKGTRIIAEQALFTISYWDTLSLEEQERSICQQMEALSDDQRDAFMSLHNALPFDNAPEQYYGIFQTNCLPLDERCDRMGIFLKACRVNHDCANNAFNSWNENIKRHTLHALRDIREGEEITILYVSGLKTRKSRQTIFQDSFGFTCSCRICSLPEPESQRRDELIENVVTMSAAGSLIGSIRPLEAMKCCRVLLMFYKREGGQEDGEFALSCENTATFFIMYGDLARAHVFAKKAAAVFSTILGSDSPKAAASAAIALDPSRHPRYGFSMKWKSAVEDIPQGLGSDDFEYWLWGRQIPDGLAGFLDLPFQYQLTTIPGVSSKKRHWYFLGQILRVEHLQHLVFLLSDMHGKERPLHFCTNEGGRELKTSQCQKGYTVAIIDAVQAFKAGDSETQPGIRLEDMRMIKIFPLPLAKMLELRDQIPLVSIRQHNNMRECHGCGTSFVADSMKRCSICFSVWYCNKGCQKAGWDSKGHKTDCKYLKDPDLRALFLFKWDEAQVCDGFPLRVADDSC